MKPEWLPGQVVAGLLDGIEIVGIVRGGGRRMFYVDSVTSDEVAIEHVQNVRPLVVIDPEDRKAIESHRDRVVHCLREWGHEVGVEELAIAMQAALRDLADPERFKPDEPNGKWAVIEDATGVTWCRAGFGQAAGHWNKIGLDVWADYADIDAVEILTPGVTP